MSEKNGKRFSSGWSVFFLAGGLLAFSACVFLASCSSDNASTPTESRTWYYESDFAANPGLEATPDQVVILDVLPSQSYTVHDEIPYRNDGAEGYVFAIPSDDPFVVRMEIRDRFGQQIAVTERGDGGVYLETPPSDYKLKVYHDGQDIPVEGSVAFIYRQHVKSALTTAGDDSSDTDSEIFSLDPGYPAYVALQFKSGDYQGQYLGLSEQTCWNQGQTFPCNLLKPVPIDSTGDEFQKMTHLFSFEASDYGSCTGGSYPPFEGDYKFHSWPGDSIGQTFSYVIWSCDLDIKCPPSQDQFPIQGETTMPAFQKDVSLPVAIQNTEDGTMTPWASSFYTEPCSPLYGAENGYLYFSLFSSTATADMFALVETFRFYKDGTQIKRDQLRAGEVALYEKEDYTGVAVVLSDSFARTTLIPLTQIASVAFGHFTDTTVQFFSGSNFSDLIRTVGVNMPGNLNLEGSSVGAIKIFDSKKILVSSKKCPNCNLAGVDLSNLNLDGADLSSADLVGASLHDASLKGSDMSNASFAGANLTNVNLSGASLYNAFLNGNTDQELGAAILTGSYLKNANLAGANLGGTDFSNASFYSGAYNAGGCAQDPDNPGFTKNCASAHGANMDAAKLTGAYLVGTDFSGTTATAADFSNAVLSGATFKDAKLEWNSSTSARTHFGGAFIGGTDFTNATVSGVNFENAYVNFNAAGECMLFQVSSTHTQFPGFSFPYGDTPCVMFAFTQATVVPSTDQNNICPDGNAGPCDTSRWTSPIIPRNQSAQLNSTCADQADWCEHIDYDWSFN